MKVNLNQGWLFSKKGEEKKISVDLPYDGMEREKRDIDAPGGDKVGFFYGGDYVYEKDVSLKKDGSVYYLDCEGMYKDPKVYLNDKKIFEANYGYSEYVIPIREEDYQDGVNHLRIETTNADQPNSRWYSGGGIYRDVSLLVYPKEHVLPKSFRISFTKEKKVKVTATLTSAFPLTLKVFDKEGKKVYEETKNEEKPVFLFTFEGLHLWSLKDPYLYTFELSYGEEKETRKSGLRTIELDEKKGFLINGERTPILGACMHSDNGLLGAESYPEVEYRKVKILKDAGYNAIRSSHNPVVESFLEACDELGLLVMDEYVDCWYIKKTKYDYSQHVEKNYPEDLKRMVDKDFSHPSVVLYSIGNEVSETAEKKGIELTKKMVDVLHSLDPSRPVTCGINVAFNGLVGTPMSTYSEGKADKQAEKEEKEAEKRKKGKKEKPSGSSDIFNTLATRFGASFMKHLATIHRVDKNTVGAFSALDVAGYNYGILRYKHDLKKYPHRFILGSETFCEDAPLFYKMYKENPRIIGDFVWTGLDYLGEAGFNSWANGADNDFVHDPSGWLLDGGGRMDLFGNWESEMDYTRVGFGLETLKLGVVSPHDYGSPKHGASWKFSRAMASYTFPGEEGKKTLAEIYTSAPYAELYLNDKRIGKFKNRKGKDYKRFKITYTPGTLKAVAYDENHKKIAEDVLVTGGENIHLVVTPEKREAKKNELVFLPIRMVDEKGDVMPLESGEIKVSSIKNGTLVRLGSAARYNKESYFASHCHLYYGQAMAIVRPIEAGEVTIEVSSDKGKASASFMALE